MSGISPAYCSLEQAYGNWNYGNKQQPQQPQQQSRLNQQIPRQQENNNNNVNNNNNNVNNNNNNVNNNNSDSNRFNGFCPNCVNCLNANNILQQRILEQTIWPRPRWIPQYPDAYEQYDPYNRYWMNNSIQTGREEFGNGGDYGHPNNYYTSIKPGTLLDIILLIIITLIILQFVEIITCICKKSN